MTMTTMPESLNSPVSGKAVFMEFGPPSQQMSPSPMSHGHYSMHCLHSAGHSQPESSYSTASSFSRPLGYPYVNSVSSHSANPYISSVQPYPNSSSLTQTRLEETGEDLVPEQALQIQEAHEAGRGRSGERRSGERPGALGRLAPGPARVEHHLGLGEELRGRPGHLHPQLHVVVPGRPPGSPAAAAADVIARRSPRFQRSRAGRDDSVPSAAEGRKREGEKPKDPTLAKEVSRLRSPSPGALAWGRRAQT
ncbi:homeobox protein DLX-1 isoform X2 [Carettochelys insculpta]|uniref:homeobox protein DLX-1 isoform X2 n=1 Tax=Carettochelys insculpta TaxID=44489 RepID=UPI003EBE3111